MRLSAPSSERRAVTGLVVVDANAPRLTESQWIIHPSWCTPAEPTQADKDATLWLHEGKVWRLATERADKGREAVFEDRFSGPETAIVKRRLRAVEDVDGSFPFVTESMNRYKYAWVPVEPEPVAEAKPVEKQYREPTAKDVAAHTVVLADIRNEDSELWQEGHRLVSVLPDGEGFSHSILHNAPWRGEPSSKDDLSMEASSDSSMRGVVMDEHENPYKALHYTVYVGHDECHKCLSRCEKVSWFFFGMYSGIAGTVSYIVVHALFAWIKKQNG